VGVVEDLASNPVLTFALKNLISEHPFITERSLTPEMIRTFGLGIARRGIMKDRLVFPIHNADSELVAYCGRWVADDPPEDEPKYKQPPQFRKELELFNWHRVKDRAKDAPVVVVESFLSVVKLHERYRVISPMGRSISEAQIELLKSGDVRSVVLLFDGDDPGRAAVTAVGRALLAHGFAVTAPIVAEDFKPHRCTDDELAKTLTGFV
jgi:DNA primase